MPRTKTFACWVCGSAIEAEPNLRLALCSKECAFRFLNTKGKRCPGPCGLYKSYKRFIWQKAKRRRQGGEFNYCRECHNAMSKVAMRKVYDKRLDKGLTTAGVPRRLPTYAKETMHRAIAMRQEGMTCDAIRAALGIKAADSTIHRWLQGHRKG